MLDSIVRPLSLLLVAGFVQAAAAADEQNDPAPPERPNKIRVLILTGGHNFEREPFFEIFKGHPDITWREVKQPEAQKWFAPERAKEYDVMVWYDMFPSIGDAAKKNLLALLDAGKPLVALHHSIADYPNWPESLQIIGGRYHLKPTADHPGSTFKHGVEVPVKIADASHPISRFMKDFTIHDEVYGKVEQIPGLKPLLTTDHPDSDKLIGWTHAYRNAPVAYIELGHGHQAYQNPSYRRLVIQSIRWAAGRLPDPAEQGFKPLFNGRSFEGWTILGDPAGFKVTEGKIHSDLPYKGEWMRTNKLYADFILRVEWRVSKGGNSGVFVRAKDKDPKNVKGTYPWNTGSEIQISNAPRGIGHCTGSLYGTVSVDPRPDESPDVWHEFEVHCRGPHYKVFADNIPVVDVDARNVPALEAKPFIGYIGLQDNHSKDGYIEYRNIRVKELKMVDGDPTPWRLGTQTYTFRLFTLFEAIDKAKALGLNYIEAYPGQRLSPDQKDVGFRHGCPPKVLDKVKRKLADTGISLQCYGVVVPKDDAEWKQIFEFARLMGIETITSEPRRAEDFDLLDKLTREYEINIAIHNHPKRPGNPGYIYWNPDEVMKLVKDRNPRIGVCADTGHWLKSGLDPVECLRKLDGRIISLHLKDLEEKAPKAKDAHWGKGVANVKGILTELHRQGFKGAFSIEYEDNWDNSMPDVAECIKFFRKTVTELGY